jgi:hypothetical protein
VKPEEAVGKARAAGHIVIIHRGQAFFNSFDYDEALKWEKLGAVIVPHFTLDEIERRKRKGRRTVQAWEVHLLGACTPEWTEDADGDQVNITNDVLLAAARERG